MAFVVDASVTAAWMLPDEDNLVAEFAQSLLADEEGCAPSIWWLEIRNLLLMAERRQRISPTQADRLIAGIGTHRIRLDYSPAEIRLLAIARQHSLTIYDASYVELAARLGVGLATLDRGMAAAAQAEGIPLIAAPSH